MIKKIFILIFLTGFFSCENSSTKVQPNQKTKQNKRHKEVLFTDFIPNDLNDSSKVRIINHLALNIDADSTLVTIETKDSLNIPLYGFYRNDSLFKILRGTVPISSDLYKPEVQMVGYGYEYTAFYFFMDSLIYSKRECSHASPRTGSCNSVYISIDSYYFNGQIIAKIIDDQIEEYWSCGCGMPPKITAQIDENSKERINYKYIEGLKERINTANKS